MQMTEKQKAKIAPILQAYRGLNTDEKKLLAEALNVLEILDATAIPAGKGPVASKPAAPKTAKTAAPKAQTAPAAGGTDGTFKCPECDRVFPSQHGRAIHVGREHTKKE